MKYREGRPEVREYDACYYEIVSVDPQTLELPSSANGPRIFIQFTKKIEMNVYIYEGKSRFDALSPIISDNQ